METIVDFRNKNCCKHGRFVWNDILQEVVKRKANGLPANILSEKEYVVSSDKIENKPLKQYGLGARYGSAYFTAREAECMVGLLNGKTVNAIAVALGLSPRTVVMHIEKMRAKVGCCTTLELIDLIRASDFLKNVNFFEIIFDFVD